MKSTTTIICFNPPKIESGDALYFFLSYLLFIFFCSSCFFCLQASTEDYKDMHMRFVVHLMFILWISFFFCFLKRTNMVLYVFLLRSKVSWLHLMFQDFKCLKWIVQPQTSFLTSKKSSLEMLYIFFWAFFCSSSSVHHVSFVYRLQLKSTNTFIWYFPFIFFFFCWYLFFFLLSQANWYGSLCFVLSCKWLLASS